MTDFNNVLDLLGIMIKNSVSEGDVVVDGTSGNGFDTLTLSNFVGENGIVYSFDIQEAAILKSKKLLEQEGKFNNVTFINDSHTKIKHHIEKSKKINCAVFNLGFLPGGDKKITTNIDSTLEAINTLLDMLTEKGVIYIVIYHGHENGKIEKDGLEEFTNLLNQKLYNCGKIEFVNQKNCPPLLMFIQKR